MPKALPLLSFAATTLAFVFNAAARIIGHDAFETSKLSAIWNQAHDVSIQNPDGTNATRGFARLNSNGGKLVGTLTLPNGSAHGLSDYSIEFYFRTQNATNSRFSLQIEGSEAATASSPTPALNLCYDAGKGWGSSGDSNGVAFWKPITGMKSISSDAWYHLRFVGRNWGETNAYYNLQLSGPDETTDATSATHLTFFQNPKNQSDPELAGQFALVNDAAGNSGFDVAEVSLAAITPYKGPVITGVNTKNLFGKVMCGYQGWFGTPDDGCLEQAWRHWTKHRGPLEDGNAKVDFWPDVSELDANQRFPTGFKMADGSPAQVFSSFGKPTVLKHFEWMQDYGIDGVFVQRFANDLRTPQSLEHCNTVLANCREGANLHGRAYAVMYDLSGLQAGHIDEVIKDWRTLRSEMVITEDPAYLNHRGKPVVALWGIGFNDGRKYTLAECRRLVEFFKNDPEAGGCTVMVGVPTHWRELSGDSVSDPELLEIAALADIISPWTVGRYADPAGAAMYAENVLKPDLAWCRQRGIDFLPVVFPGFSWHNMVYGAKSDQIPRLKGQFLWSQFLQAKKANVSMVYVAMFDEVDEGTAIFKCVNDVPVGQKSKFLTFEGLPSDFYLKMVGAGSALIRGDSSSPQNAHTIDGGARAAAQP
jgi:hypothetical protein